MAARRRYSSKSYYGYPRYVTIAERQYQASEEIKAMHADGAKPSPVVIQGRAIASTFWGKAWCDNVESYQDYSNRLPRGRSYVRSGAVIDLQIKEGHVSAKVMGSSRYSIEMDIQKLSSSKWQQIKHACAGKISSLVDLISGRLSPEIMAVLCRKNDGLFPTPSEIKMTCSCPDWASLCKHLAAVLYGIGARLDTEPELFFLLRGVDQKELLSTSIVESVVAGATQGAISDGDLKGIFNIDLDGLDGLDGQTPVQEKTPASKAATDTAAATTAGTTPAPATKRKPGRPKKASAETNPATAAKRKPGRPKKASAAAASINTPPAAAKTKTATPAPAAKRKPGRPKKEPATTVKATPATTTKRKPGRPQKAAATALDGNSATAAKRKPGRPRKSDAAAPPAAEKGRPRKGH